MTGAMTSVFLRPEIRDSPPCDLDKVDTSDGPGPALCSGVSS